MIEPHELGENAIRELALNLYRDPKSAIKEGITNGLDEQWTKDKDDRRIEISTHVGDDDSDDIHIIDFGFGVQKYEEFKKYLRGHKEVSGRVSSYTQIDPEIGGNKGLGKLGLLMLAGGDNPTVEFWSHRPAIGDEKRKGMIIKMTFAGFETDPVDTIDALTHPGVKVVIKNARYDLLGSESVLISYISQMFAIRISRGTKIILNGNQIAKPENFDSREYELFTLSDGTSIKGNIKSSDKSDNKNVWIFNKTIYVDALTFEHKCKGWINDNLIVPTSSRESINETQRWTEIKQKLREYLDDHFEVPTTPKIGRMGREKEKKALILKALQFRDYLLSGHYDPKGIFGEITGGLDIKGKLQKKIGVKLTQTGDKGGPPVIPIGTGTRGKGGRYGGNGNKPGYEENGDHDILTESGNNPRMRKGPVNPDISVIVLHAPEKPVMAEFSPNGLQLIMNTYWPQTKKAHTASGPDWAYLVAPVYAQALTNLDMSTNKENLTPEEWQNRNTIYMKFFIDGA